MSPIRILHISDLHLAEFPQRHSVLDQFASIRSAIKHGIIEDLKRAMERGQLGDLRAAFQNILDGESIELLKKAIEGVDSERVNEVVNDILERIIVSDGSLQNLTSETLRSLTIATSYNPGALDCLCNFIDDENVNAIIITGDLATTGLPEDLAKAKTFLDGTSEFDQSIAGVSAPILVLPGNHDRFIYVGNGFLFAPGGKEFDSSFDRHWSGPVQAYEALRSEDERLSVIIVAADFGLLSPGDCTLPLLKINRLAQGRVYKNVLDELERATTKAQEDERNLSGRRPIMLWAIHFPPFFPYEKAGRVSRAIDRLSKGLIDEEHLIASARKHNVSAILAGHTHEADDYPAGYYRIRVLCAGTATQDDVADKHCQIIEIDKNFIGQPRIIVKHYLQENDRSTFVAM